MAAKRCYYEVLGVARDASNREIASAYRKLAIKYHPDSNPNNDEAIVLFKEAAEAYEVLNDPEKRARYDRYGHAGVGNGAAGGAGFRDVEDIFDAFGDIFGGGVFDGLFGGRRRGRRQRGADISTEVVLDLEEAYSGVEKEIQLDRHHPCETCQGSGARPGSQPATCAQCGGHGQVVQSAGILRVQTTCPNCRGAGRIITDRCPECRGHGFVAVRDSLTVQIPAGVDDGMHVRLRGRGEPAPPGGEPGDCLVLIRVRQHELFEREGPHLFLNLPISYTQAVLGATLDVPTMARSASITVPAGTASGQVFQLNGLGMPQPRGGGRGNLVVRVFVEVPKKVGRRQEELLRELAEIEDKDVTPHRQSILERLKNCFASHPSEKEKSKREEETK